MVSGFRNRCRSPSPVLAWLLDYINERIADDKRWNVSDEVKSFGRNIFDEGYIEKGEGLRQRLQILTIFAPKWNETARTRSRAVHNRRKMSAAAVQHRPIQTGR